MVYILGREASACLRALAFAETDGNTLPVHDDLVECIKDYSGHVKLNAEQKAYLISSIEKYLESNVDGSQRDERSLRYVLIKIEDI